MSGRFFSVPLFFSTALLTRKSLPSTVWIGLAVFFLFVGLLPRNPVLSTDETYGRDMVWHAPNGSTDPANITDRRGIADERAAYFQGSGLITSLTHSRYEPTFDWVAMGRDARGRGRHIVAFQTPGFYGYYAGPSVHIVDTYALCDPLLSKLPITPTGEWRVGHYRRGVPVGYIESIQTGENLIADVKIRELYRVIKILTQDPIWSVTRFKEIAKMNLGFYKGLVRSIDLTNVAPPPEARTVYRFREPPASR